MQLKALSERVQVILGPMVNVGVILLADDRVALIDSGFDRRYARKILELLTDCRYQVAAVLNTHAHADHVGGNRFLAESTQCRILAGPQEAPAVQNPLIQAIALFGGFPFEELKNSFIVAESSPAEIITDPVIQLDDLAIQVLDLPGHSIGQKGFFVDGVAFVGDSMFSSELVNKQTLLYMYNPLEYLETLNQLKSIKANWFVGGHFAPEKNIEKLISDNKRQVEAAFAFLRKILATPQPLDKLVKEYLSNYRVRKTAWEHFLYRSTLNGYLSSLKHLGEAEVKVMDHLLVWYATGKTANPANPVSPSPTPPGSM